MQSANPDMIIEHRRGEFLISTDPARLDLDVIHGFLTNCYWAKGVPREVVARSIEHALCFGVYDGSGASLRLEKDARHGAPTDGILVQVGFARVISDFATVAYVGDVFVLDSHRGQGAGQVADGVHHSSIRHCRDCGAGFSPLATRTGFMRSLALPR